MVKPRIEDTGKDPFLGLHPMVALELAELEEELGLELWWSTRTLTKVQALETRSPTLRCAMHRGQQRRFPPPLASAYVLDISGNSRRLTAVCQKHAAWVLRKKMSGTWRGCWS